MATIKSLVKKILKKAAKSKKQKHCFCDMSISDSHSELEIRCCETELVVDKHLKLDNLFMSDLQSVQPRPTKVTDPIPINIMADERLLKMQQHVK
jgi:hypothetical protein